MCAVHDTPPASRCIVLSRELVIMTDMTTVHVASCLLLSLTLPLLVAAGQQCQTNPVTQSGSKLVFADLPSLHFTLDPLHHPNGLEPWFGLANGITNGFRPGGLPYDLLGGPLFTNDDLTRDEFNPSKLIGYWKSFIGVSFLAVILALCTPVCGCCFCCFRLCGLCGGKVKQEETKYTGHLTLIFTILLVLLTCGLFVGVVISFHVDSMLLHSVDQFQSVSNASIQGGGDYILHTVDEFRFLLCQLNKTRDISVGVIQDVGDDVVRVVSSFNGQANQLFGQFDQIEQGIKEARVQLPAVNYSLTTVIETGAMLNISQLRQSVTHFRQSCLNSSVQQEVCRQLNSSLTDLDELKFNKDLQQARQVLSEMQLIINGLNKIDVSSIVNQANSTYYNTTNNIKLTILGTVSDTKQKLMSIDPANELQDSFDYIALSVTRSNGLQDSASQFVSAAVKLLRPIAIGVYVLVFIPVLMVGGVITLLLVGSVCGSVGAIHRKTASSPSCTKCGAVGLLVGVGFSFYIGCLLLLLVAVFFISGGIGQKVCGSISYPQYEFFVQEVPNLSYNLGDRELPIKLEQVLRNCHDNQSLYRALDMDSLFNISNVSAIEIQPDSELRQQVIKLFKENPITLSSLLPISITDALQNLMETPRNAINVTQRLKTAQLDLQRVTGNISDVINTTVSDSAATSALENEGQALLGNLTAVSNILSTFRSDLNTLQGKIGTLNFTVVLLGVDANAITSSASSLVDNLNGPNGIQKINMTVLNGYDVLLSYSQQLGQHFIDTVINELGNCYPIWAIYTAEYNVLCLNLINGMNGTWLGLTWCWVLLMPLVVTAVLLSHQYRKMSKNSYVLTLPTVVGEEEVILLKPVEEGSDEDEDDNNNDGGDTKFML